MFWFSMFVCCFSNVLFFDLFSILHVLILFFKFLGKTPFWRRWSRKMRQGRFPPFGSVSAEFWLWELGLAPFLEFFDFRINPFRRGSSRKMRQGRFHPFGSVLAGSGLWELGLAPFLAFFWFPEKSGRTSAGVRVELGPCIWFLLWSHLESVTVTGSDLPRISNNVHRLPVLISQINKAIFFPHPLVKVLFFSLPPSSFLLLLLHLHHHHQDSFIWGGGGSVDVVFASGPTLIHHHSWKNVEKCRTCKKM